MVFMYVCVWVMVMAVYFVTFTFFEIDIMFDGMNLMYYVFCPFSIRFIFFGLYRYILCGGR